MLRKETRIVNEHGVIVSENSFNIPEAFDEETGYLFFPNKNHSKSYHEIPFPAAMSMVDIGRMMVLSKRIWSNTNLLGEAKRGGIQPYGISDIGRVIGVEDRQAYRFVDRMLKLGILARNRVDTEGIKEIQYYINPIYWFSGKRIPLNLYLLFRRQLDALLPPWVVERFGAKEAEKKAKEKWGMK